MQQAIDEVGLIADPEEKDLGYAGGHNDWIRRHKAICTGKQQESAAALDWASQVAARDISNPQVQASVLAQIAEIAVSQGEMAKAIELIERAQDRDLRSNIFGATSAMLQGKAGQLHNLGNSAEANRLTDQAIELIVSAATYPDKSRALVDLAEGLCVARRDRAGKRDS